MIVLSVIWGLSIFAILILLSFGTYSVLLHTSVRKNRSVESTLAISLSNCFACGVFLSTCFLGLLPHLREHELRIRAVSSMPLPSSELIVLVGFSLILLIEQIVHALQHKNSVAIECSSAPKKDVSSGEDSLDVSSGVPKIEFHRVADEHSVKIHGGHSHADFLSNELSFSLFALLIGLSSHSIFEGVALGVQRDQSDFYGLLIAIMVHEVLCSFAFGVSLVQHNTPPKVALVSVIILSASIPLGMTSSFVINSLNTFNALLCRFVMEGLAAGTFIYVSCIEMLSAELSARIHGAKAGLSKAVAVASGIFVFFLLNLKFGHHMQEMASGVTMKSV